MPGWYLTKRNESRVNDAHQDALLNTVYTDRNLAVTIFDRLESAKTTEEGTRRTKKLSLRALEKLSADVVHSADEDEDDNALTFDSDDADLSYEREETKVVTDLTKEHDIQPSAETLTALTQIKRLIKEISLTSSE